MSCWCNYQLQPLLGYSYHSTCWQLLGTPWGTIGTPRMVPRVVSRVPEYINHIFFSQTFSHPSPSYWANFSPNDPANWEEFTIEQWDLHPLGTQNRSLRLSKYIISQWPLCDILHVKSHDFSYLKPMSLEGNEEEEEGEAGPTDAAQNGDYDEADVVTLIGQYGLEWRNGAVFVEFIVGCRHLVIIFFVLFEIFGKPSPRKRVVRHTNAADVEAVGRRAVAQLELASERHQPVVTTEFGKLIFPSLVCTIL